MTADRTLGPGPAGCARATGRAARLAWLNGLPEEAAEAVLREVCGSPAWAARVARSRPWTDAGALAAAAEAAWDALAEIDWRAAFAAHPAIGESRTEDGAPAGRWSAGEQRQAAEGEAAVRLALAERQREYRARFGHGFLIRAAGRDAAEILAACEKRLANDARTELSIAAAEEREIGRRRLERLLTEGGKP